MYDIQTLIDVPEVLLKAMNWKRSVPSILMVYFSPEYAALGHLKGLTFANGLLHSDHLELDHALNDELDRNSYQIACGHWLDLMRLHPNPKVNKAAALWDPIIKTHLLPSQAGLEGWPAERAYLNLLRRVAKPVGNVTPTWSQDSLWSRARTMATMQSFKAFVANPSFNPYNLPYQNQFPKPSQSFLPKSDSFRTESSKTEKAFRERYAPSTSQRAPKFCFVCGRYDDHYSKDCQASKQENGRDILISRNAKGNWTLLGGASFCYNFNGTSSSGCSEKDCPKGKHVCARCLGTTHGARKCPES